MTHDFPQAKCDTPFTTGVGTQPFAEFNEILNNLLDKRPRLVVAYFGWIVLKASAKLWQVVEKLCRGGFRPPAYVVN